MRALFGVVGLLVVLAVVGLLAVKQLGAAGHGASASPRANPDLPQIPQMSGSGSARQQAEQIENKVAADVAKAMSQGAAAHKEEADKP